MVEEGRDLLLVVFEFATFSGTKVICVLHFTKNVNFAGLTNLAATPFSGGKKLLIKVRFEL